MSKNRIVLISVLALASTATAVAQTTPDPSKAEVAKAEPTKIAVEQASIPFVNHGSIYDWQANKRDGIWIQDIHRRWYYAETMGPCMGLDYATAVAFDAKPMGTLDRFSAVIVPHEMRCPFKSLVRSDAPPPHKARKPHKVKDAPAT